MILGKEQTAISVDLMLLIVLMIINLSINRLVLVFAFLHGLELPAKHVKSHALIQEHNLIQSNVIVIACILILDKTALVACSLNVQNEE
jgi:hypothetical protein